MKKKFIQVSKDGFNGYFGGYGINGGIAPAHQPLSARMFDIGETWLEGDEEIGKAINYLEENGYVYEIMVLEYSYYKD